jgi:hypothetical protein
VENNICEGLNNYNLVQFQDIMAFNFLDLQSSTSPHITWLNNKIKEINLEYDYNEKIIRVNEFIVYLTYGCFNIIKENEKFKKTIVAKCREFIRDAPDTPLAKSCINLLNMVGESRYKPVNVVRFNTIEKPDRLLSIYIIIVCICFIYIVPLLKYFEMI